METYSEFRPTQFDRHISIDSKEHWLVLPTGRNRDSNILTESNFELALQMLGGESDTVDVHRFGRWAHGWFEIIIVDPESPQAKIAEDIERSLEDYPVLSDDHYSNKMIEAQADSFAEIESNFRCDLEGKFRVETEYSFEDGCDLSDVPFDDLWDYFDTCAKDANTDWEDSDNGLTIHLDFLVEKATLQGMIRALPNIKVHRTLLEALPHKFMHEMVHFGINVHDLNGDLFEIPDFIAVQYNVNQLTIGDILK